MQNTNVVLNVQTRDEIVKVLQQQIVPAPAGSVLMQIAQILANLKPLEAVKPEAVKPVEPTPTPVTADAPAEPVADQNV